MRQQTARRSQSFLLRFDTNINHICIQHLGAWNLKPWRWGTVSKSFFQVLFTSRRERGLMHSFGPLACARPVLVTGYSSVLTLVSAFGGVHRLGGDTHLLRP